MDINNKNNKRTTLSLWAQETQQAPNRTWKGVFPRFQDFFCCCPIHCSSLFSALAQRRQQGKMPPGPFRELVKWARKWGREEEEEREGVKDAWCLPLICHKDGRHVMIANVEQIGLEKEEEEDRVRGRGDRWRSWPGANNTNT